MNNVKQKSLHLAQFFQERCVLQSGKKTLIWGWGEEGKKISISFQGRSWDSYVKEDKDFFIELDDLQIGGPFTMEVTMEEECIVIKEVYVGDVFVCGGQSNMELPMRRVREKYENEFVENGWSHIFVYKVSECLAFDQPLVNHTHGYWQQCSGEELEEVSAFSYFFAKFLNKDRKIPIGIINLSVGGTPVEAWTSKDGLRDCKKQLQILEEYKDLEYRQKLLEDQEIREKKWYRNLELMESSTDNNNLEWKKINLPCNFNEEGIVDFSGVMWLRKKFHLKKGQEIGESLLTFGTLVDSDKTYLNGVFIGETTYCFPPRRYEISNGILKEGENEIVIRLVCRDGKGRVTKGKKYELCLGTGECVDLTGEYQIRAECEPALPLIFLHRVPTVLFQGMVFPCCSYGVKGVVWYQGESNDRDPDSYEQLLKIMICDWRNHWKQEKLPFIIVQLPNCHVENAIGDSWPKIREAQYKAQELEDVVTTVNIDLGEDNDLHPLNKRDVAYRAYLAARHLIYKDNTVIYQGPTLKSYEKKDGFIQLLFDLHGAKSFICFDNKPLEEFVIIEKDGTSYRPRAEMIENYINIYCNHINKVEKLQYAWSKTPKNGLIGNELGLLESPFSILIQD